MVEMMRISYINLYKRGVITKEEYDKYMKNYKPNDIREISVDEYNEKTGKVSGYRGSFLGDYK